MELTKELKEKVEKAKTKEEAKKILEEAGMALDDEEVEQVAGGIDWEKLARRVIQDGEVF